MRDNAQAVQVEPTQLTFPLEHHEDGTPGFAGLRSHRVERDLDPAKLTFESLRKHWLERDDGRWSDAVAEDIDIDLLERNLELTPHDRFVQLQQMLRIYFSRARER